MIKSTGIVRDVDPLGRVVIPIELRKTMDIQEYDPLEIYTNDNQILLKKYQPACILCGSAENLSTHQGKKICQICRTGIAKESVVYLHKASF
ncbi:MAG: AbrB/MazE/SpoVT family DNA-binding domain-containing protein [Syntrophomonadaceae bacterium]|nr:AbrB/MazE/SpoVT family DNA-binding domain-containing protein [Syntrophomonadaceae bacterium]